MTDAIELAAASAPGSVGARAAWEQAERATAELGELIELALDLVGAAPKSPRAPGRGVTSA